MQAPSWQGQLAQNRVEWGQSLALAASAGTVILYLGVAEEPGLAIRQFVLVPSSALGLNAVTYHTFKPFVNTVLNGVSTVRYLGTARSTNAYNLTQNLPFRLHEEEFLNERLAKGAMVGVEIVTSGAPAAVRALVQARLFYAR